MKHLPLAELRIQHAYYNSGRCPDFEVAPTAAGARVIAGHRLVVKPRPDGLLVLAPVDDAGAPFIGFGDGAALGFELRARNPDLAQFTDLSALQGVESPLYVGGGAGGELTLTAGETARRRGVFAGVELRDVGAAWLQAGAAVFTITLAARRARWLYYVVTDLADAAIELVDAGASPLAFTPEHGADLRAAPDPSDRQAAALAAAHPDARLLRFVSDAPVACAEEPRRGLELRAGGERLPLRVPNPAFTDTTSLELTDGAIPQRQESLFRVVKHLTHSFPTNG